jgi:hypothetical protein
VLVADQMMTIVFAEDTVCESLVADIVNVLIAAGSVDVVVAVYVLLVFVAADTVQMIFALLVVTVGYTSLILVPVYLSSDLGNFS